ncbi:Maf1 regulator-domain-containing protein [Globomyces pollinis-pini]|nr:Maf1 regulator-domain-containing protein [Globomyces pollinis-pini]
MKYLPNEDIEQINSQLGCIDNGDTRIFCRMEAYSCKRTREDKELKRHMNSKYENDDDILLDVLSPRSPFGPLSQMTSRKTLFYLLGTLNAVYPDYDFSDIKPELFTKIPAIGMAINHVNNLFLVQFENSQGQIGQTIWNTVDQVISTNNCDIYQFTPDRDIEPDAEEGNLWSFYYFFYNKQDKRILFFSGRAVSLLAPIQPEENVQIIYDYDYDEDRNQNHADHTSLSYEQYTMQAMEI